MKLGFNKATALVQYAFKEGIIDQLIRTTCFLVVLDLPIIGHKKILEKVYFYYEINFMNVIIL